MLKDKLKKKKTDLSEVRPLSDNEWESTVPGMSGPLRVWRLFTVLALACITSFSEVDAFASVLDPFLFHPTFSWLLVSSKSLSGNLPFLFKLSTRGNLPPLNCLLYSACCISLFEFTFNELDWEPVVTCKQQTSSFAWEPKNS